MVAPVDSPRPPPPPPPPPSPFEDEPDEPSLSWPAPLPVGVAAPPEADARVLVAAEDKDAVADGDVVDEAVRVGADEGRLLLDERALLTAPQTCSMRFPAASDAKNVSQAILSLEEQVVSRQSMKSEPDDAGRSLVQMQTTSLSVQSTLSAASSRHSLAQSGRSSSDAMLGDASVDRVGLRSNRQMTDNKGKAEDGGMRGVRGESKIKTRSLICIFQSDHAELVTELPDPCPNVQLFAKSGAGCIPLS
ncbi:hypothetical protein VTK73DRAFT_1855 [Phialemonium thermophilum]|uniref:Uncharacterized protein n=1 Tax=Phialemonium thermophilum TaxID=223376 RepID=A0ABR3VSU6_9PEZI